MNKFDNGGGLPDSARYTSARSDFRGLGQRPLSDFSEAERQQMTYNVNGKRYTYNQLLNLPDIDISKVLMTVDPFTGQIVPTGELFIADDGNEYRYSTNPVVVTPKKSGNSFQNWIQNGLDNIVSTVKSTTDIFTGPQRTENYQRAMDRDPNFQYYWDGWNNIGEFMNYSTAGLLNRLSPTQNIGLAIDLFKGKDLGQSWMGNSGIVSDEFARQHPYWAMAFNLAGDLGISTSASQVYKWGTTPKLIGSGAESEVWSSPFSNHVIKYSSITPEEMRMMNSIPGFAKAEYLGQTTDGLYIYKQQKLIIPKDQIQQLRQIAADTSKRHFKMFPYGNDASDVVFTNPSNNMYFVDAQVGRDRFSGVRRFIDGSLFDRNTFMNFAYKKGGKIHIKKKNRGKFTEYCNGKVTDECIRRGKKSPNPIIRKRATFAQSARSWKK